MHVVDLSDVERAMAVQAWFGLAFSFLIGGIYWPIMFGIQRPARPAEQS